MDKYFLQIDIFLSKGGKEVPMAQEGEETYETQKAHKTYKTQEVYKVIKFIKKLFPETIWTENSCLRREDFSKTAW